MKKTGKILFLLVLSILISLISLLSVHYQDKIMEKERFGSRYISVVISTSDYSGIYHDNVILSSEKKIRIRRDNEIEIVPKKENCAFSRNECVPGSVLHIETEEDAKLQIDSLARAQGCPSYFGSIDLYGTENGYVIVNCLPLETYLRFVVPSEMPSDYGDEALKAQAVCARTFAMQHILNPAYPEYHANLDDSIRYQVYNNQNCNENTDRAIKDTTDMVLEYQDTLISTYYYSTSWGYSTDPSIWNGAACDYYQSKEISEAHEFLDLTDEAVFAAQLQDNTDTYENEEPWYRWAYTLSADEIIENINTCLDFDVSSIQSLSVKQRRAGGSVSDLQVVSGNQVYDLTREADVRNIFIPKHADISRNDGSVLHGYEKCPSSYYRLEPTYENGMLTACKIIGGGCGHGLGMSQNAAKALAAEGKNYQDILTYFYAGTNVAAFPS